jgi:hypothetical protein
MPPGLSSEKKLETFLTDLARERDVSASTQNQAFNAILYFYQEGLGQPLGNVKALRATRPVHERHAPTVPMIYTALGFWDGSVGSTAFSANPLWAENWRVACPNLAEGWTNWVFWQYSDSGNVSGISTVVDLDKFNGSLSDLLAVANEPSLNIALHGTNEVSVTWSTLATGFVLEQNSNLNTTNWVTVTNTLSIVSNQEQVILGTSTKPTLFRLFHP